MDTMTGTKVAAAMCSTLLVFLLAKWAAEEIYHVGGHGEASYVIETNVEELAGSRDEIVPDFNEVLAAADADKGAKVFKKCAACHKLEDGANATGPHLFDIVGRPVAAVSGFNYSPAMADHGGEWTPDALNEFLEKPSGYVPGTAMSFNGLKKISDRADLVAYLNSLGG